MATLIFFLIGEMGGCVNAELQFDPRTHLDNRKNRAAAGPLNSFKVRDTSSIAIETTVLGDVDQE